eukprot:scaffold395_cov243-Pinguiococcus_pyrenoidosus.AAC.42
MPQGDAPSVRAAGQSERQERCIGQTRYPQSSQPASQSSDAQAEHRPCYSLAMHASLGSPSSNNDHVPSTAPARAEERHRWMLQDSCDDR